MEQSISSEDGATRLHRLRVHRDTDDETPRARRPVKETLDARSEYTTSQDDGTSEHHINQYIIRQEIGRGSFGAVHLAADQFGNEYAVKEFSKSRLRKRAQSHLLRRPRGPQRPGTGFNSPLHRHPSEDGNENAKNPLYLIKEEIAIMKKLNHSNLVSLIEVLDDPNEDSLYMVMEMCKKGVVMKIGLGERADPYDDEHCRCWFRDLILGVEYLHAQGIVHRDIKPDNCLVTSDDVLKVVDFGVSEMFEKNSTMFTAKSAGSPAFLPPELCVVKHGDVSGKAADIWSMGVTLYCLRYGKLPFEHQSIFELYASIRTSQVVCEEEPDENFKDLMSRILEKDPEKRIKMSELRDHPWVTANGADPLLSSEENTAQIVEPPTEEEMNQAITKNMGSLMTLMKAAKKFKRLVNPSKEGQSLTSILGDEYEAHFVEPPMEMDDSEDFPTVGLDANAPGGPNTGLRKFLGRNPMLGCENSAAESSVYSEGSFSSRPDHSPSSSPWPSGVFEPERKDSGSIRSGRSAGKDFTNSQSASPHPALSRASSATTKRSIEGTRGHARDPLEEEFPYLFIGPSTYTGTTEHDTNGEGEPPNFAKPDPENTDDVDVVAEPTPIVSESPGAAEFDIYETAYRRELERIETKTHPGTGPKVYLNRRVRNTHEVLSFVKDKALDLQIGQKKLFSALPQGPGGFSAAVSMLRSQMDQKGEQKKDQESHEAGLEQELVQEQEQEQRSEEGTTPRRESYPSASSLSSQGQSGPEPSLNEATGVNVSESSAGGEDSSRRSLGRVRDK
ncbi:uncharacterized protein N7477_009184 [Penicillium maclennaniae]|uniref:uncharacterized protein n=1 Tax=Penicillium maclennaniae TaxID=1343394 RepID=UPI0025401850|nr:uncharacterized protein N7477_009184 [Penicillium maclennaniae]KAJ5661568.1 hypothetical protein N7477_009184 [Penicillium maclennaniae]